MTSWSTKFHYIGYQTNHANPSCFSSMLSFLLSWYKQAHKQFYLSFCRRQTSFSFAFFAYRRSPIQRSYNSTELLWSDCPKAQNNDELKDWPWAEISPRLKIFAIGRFRPFNCSEGEIHPSSFTFTMSSILRNLRHSSRGMYQRDCT